MKTNRICSWLLFLACLLAWLGLWPLSAHAALLAFEFSEPLDASSRRTGLVISEIMYHPARRTDGRQLEFVELFNSQPFPEAIGGYRLSGDIDYRFPDGTLLAGNTFLVVARNPADVRSLYGIDTVVGPFTNNLPNDAGRVRLRNRADAIQLEVNYGSKTPWPRAADGAGHSLVLARPSYGEGDPRAWAASDAMGGGPGRMDDFSTEPMRAVVINEFLAHSAAPNLDFIELYNHGNVPVDLSGAWLSDDPDTNKFRIPDQTVLPARGFVAFDQNQLGFALASGGESLYLVNSNRTRVIDAVGFDAQALEVTTGRCPDGAPGLQELEAATPGAPNAPTLTRDLVINEIMYHPLSRDADDEYLELLNRGTEPVNLAGWELTDGIAFTFPENTVLPAGGYLVVAKNLTNLLAQYPQLNSGNAVGNFQGKLANGGERIALTAPETIVSTNRAGEVTTNLHHIVMDEVTYGDGGRWSPWADAGGSSLELIDPHSDNRLAANWAASDETAKGDWTTVELTGVLDHGTLAASSLDIFLMGAGECLLDDIEVIGPTGGNRVSNGSFASGLSPWLAQGNHDISFLQPTGGINDSPCLHVRTSGKGSSAGNRLVTTLTSSLPLRATATLRAKVRWLRGHPEILLRLYGNGLEGFGYLPGPSNPGTPGEANSQVATNAGPVIDAVSHHPILPAAGEPVVVTARIHDPDGLSQALVHYRFDPDTNTVLTVPLVDDGTGGDAVSGDGLFSAILPGQAAGALVAFHIVANDNAPEPVTRTFPSDAPVRECLIRFGEIEPPGAFGTYRVWITQATFDEWSNRIKLSDQALDATFVYGNQRVIYNAGARYAGAGAGIRDYDTPTGVACDYKLLFPADELFLGTDEATILWPGLSGNRTYDATGQQEQTVYWLAGSLGLPFNYQRHVNLFVNGLQRSFIMLDTQKPGRDLLRQWYADDAAGDLFKIQLSRDYDVNLNWGRTTSARLGNFTTTGGAKKTAAYRPWWSPRAAATYNHFDNLFALADAVNGPDDNYVARIEDALDIEQWMRTFAVEHIVGNWDSYGYGLAQNMYAYKPQGGRWKMIIWDVDVTLGVGDPPTANLFLLNNPFWPSLDGDPAVVGRMYATPKFARAYWRALQDAVDGPLLPANLNARLDARSAAFAANGIAAASPGNLKSYLTTRRNFIVGQLATVNAPFAGASPQFIATDNNLVTLTGTAPVAVRNLTFNGMPFPVTWTSVNEWSADIVVQAGTNEIVIESWDRLGQELAGMQWTNTVLYTGPDTEPAGAVVINEIMYQPNDPGAAYVELHNTSRTVSFDLSNWRLHGVDYTFPPGSILAAGDYLVLAEDRSRFEAAYGADLPLFAEFNGTLQTNGETLTLVRPGLAPDSEVIVDQVRYESAPPWPAGANGAGASLQLIDATQDNSRVSNWSDGAGWRFFSFTNVAGPGSSQWLFFLDTAGSVYLDDMALVEGSVPGAGNNLLVNGDFEAPLAGSWLFRGNYVTNSTVSTAFKHGGSSSLLLEFSRPGNVANYIYQRLTGIDPVATYTLSFWYLPTTNANQLLSRLSSAFRPTANLRPMLTTPATANNVTGSLPPYPTLWLNEVAPVNLAGVTDNAGEPEPWIELFNPGAQPVALDGLRLSDTYTDLARWTFPPGAVIEAGQFLLVWADGESAEATPTDFHTSFRLTTDTGSVVLSRVVDGEPQIVDYLNFAAVPRDGSFGAVPDGQPFYREPLSLPTPGGPNHAAALPLTVAINEWMAANTAASGILDPADGDSDDWFELSNPGPDPVELGGYYLTDEVANRFKFRIPAGYRIAPNGFLLVWADEETGQNRPELADLHVNFRLSRRGEAIGLFAADGSEVTAVQFGPQTNNVSEGRFPDGAAARYFMPAPTPRLPNRISPTPAAPEIRQLARLPNGMIQFSFPSQTGFSYRVEYKEHLAAAEWIPLGEPTNGTGGLLSIRDDPSASPQRYYRVTIVP